MFMGDTDTKYNFVLRPEIGNIIYIMSFLHLCHKGIGMNKGRDMGFKMKIALKLFYRQ